MNERSARHFPTGPSSWGSEFIKNAFLKTVFQAREWMRYHKIEDSTVRLTWKAEKARFHRSLGTSAKVAG